MYYQLLLLIAAISYYFYQWSSNQTSLMASLIASIVSKILVSNISLILIKMPKAIISDQGIFVTVLSRS